MLDKIHSFYAERVMDMKNIILQEDRYLLELIRAGNIFAIREHKKKMLESKMLLKKCEAELKRFNDYLDAKGQTWEYQWKI